MFSNETAKQVCPDRNWLVLGADGLIGSRLAHALRSQGAVVLETTRRRETLRAGRELLDLGNPTFHAPRSTSGGIAVLCAARTSVLECEREPDETWQVNVNATLALARDLVDAGARLIYLSSNLVFDGSQPFPEHDAPVNPQTEYGRQKAAVEQELLRSGAAAAIVRLSKVVGERMPLIERWKADLAAGKTIHPFHDLACSPVPVEFVAAVLTAIGTRGLTGVIQVSGRQDIVYADAARRLVDDMALPRRRLVPVSAAESGLTLGMRPPHTTLGLSRLCSELEMEPPDVWATMESLIQCGRHSDKSDSVA